MGAIYEADFARYRRELLPDEKVKQRARGSWRVAVLLKEGCFKGQACELAKLAKLDADRGVLMCLPAGSANGNASAVNNGRGQLYLKARAPQVL